MGYLTAMLMELLISFASRGFGGLFSLADVAAQGGFLPGGFCILPAQLTLFLADLPAQLRALPARIGRVLRVRGCGAGHKDCNASQGQRESRVLPFAFHLVSTEQLTQPVGVDGKNRSCVPIASTRPSAKGAPGFNIGFNC